MLSDHWPSPFADKCNGSALLGRRLLTFREERHRVGFLRSIAMSAYQDTTQFLRKGRLLVSVFGYWGVSASREMKTWAS